VCRRVGRASRGREKNGVGKKRVVQRVVDASCACDCKKRARKGAVGGEKKAKKGREKCAERAGVNVLGKKGSRQARDVNGKSRKTESRTVRPVKPEESWKRKKTLSSGEFEADRAKHGHTNITREQEAKKKKNKCKLT